VQRSFTFEFRYILISGDDGDQFISVSFRLLEKIYMPGMYDIKCSESEDGFHILLFKF